MNEMKPRKTFRFENSPQPRILEMASFFAGIGGFDLGFEKSGFSVVFNCENNKFCRAVLNEHWPNNRSFEDIIDLTPEQIPDSEVWCGGFPCQDLSVARGSNDRHGLKGSRSGLFFKLLKLAEEKKPKVILLENVHGLLNSNGGKDFAELLHGLNNLKYAVSWRLLNSRYFGLPQSRPRVYICAWIENPLSALYSLFENSYSPKLTNERRAFLETSVLDRSGPIVPKLAFCLAATSGRHTGTDWSRTYVPYADEVRRLTPLECERLQGFPDNWTDVRLQTVNSEKVDSLRYHAIGNAVSVNVIEWIANRIKNELLSSKLISHTSEGQKFLSDILLNCSSLRSNKLVFDHLSLIRNSENKFTWPNAGIAWDGQFIANTIPPSPCKLSQADLADIIEKGKPEARYFLSPNAAEGILRRVDSQNRHLFLPLRSALEKLSGRIQESRFEQKDTVIQADIYLDEIECV